MLKRIVFFGIIFLLVSSSAVAQDFPAFRGEEVVVIGRLPLVFDSLSKIPANVTVITRKDIEESGATNLFEVLNQYESLIIADSSGFGLEVYMGMRGFGGEGKSVLILLDGVRISGPFDNSLTFWKLVPMQEIERVEIIRGGWSSIYGGEAIAGVINITTQKGSEIRKTNGELSFGSYGRQKYYISTSGPLSDWKYYVNIGKEQSNGYRENSEHDETTILVKFDHELDGDRKLGISFKNLENKGGISGGILKTAVEQNPRQKGSFVSDSDGFDNRISSCSMNYHQGPLSINLFSESRTRNSTLTYSSGTFEVSLLTKSLGGTVQITRKDKFAKNANLLMAGLEYRKHEIDNPSIFTSTFGPWPTQKAINKNIWGIFLQNDLTLANRLTISLGVRYDKEDFDLIDRLVPSNDKIRSVSNLSPKVGIIYSVNKSVSIFANAAQSFKAPDANAMIFEAPGLFSANPDIDPMTANNFEAGFRHIEKEGVESKISVYRIDSRREILYNILTFQNENFDTLRRGLELSLRRPLTKKAIVSFSYTYSNAIFSSGQFEGKRIPLVPENKYTAQVDYKISDDLNFRVDWLKVVGQFVLNDFNNIYPMKDYSISNSKLSFKKGNFDAYLAVRNLFNEKYSSFVSYSGDVYYYPAPERSYMGGITYDF